MSNPNDEALGRYYPSNAITLEIKPIVHDDGRRGGHKVFLNGTEITGVKHLWLGMGCDMVNTLILEMSVGKVQTEVFGYRTKDEDEIQLPQSD